MAIARIIILICCIQLRTSVVHAPVPVMAPATPADIRRPAPAPGMDGTYARPFLHAEDCREDEEYMGTFCVDFRMSAGNERNSRRYWVSCRPRSYDAKVFPPREPIVRRIVGYCPDETLCYPHVKPELAALAVGTGIDPQNHGAIVKWAKEFCRETKRMTIEVTKKPKSSAVTDHPVDEDEPKPQVDCAPQPDRMRWGMKQKSKPRRNAGQQRRRFGRARAPDTNGASTSGTGAEPVRDAGPAIAAPAVAIHEQPHVQAPPADGPGTLMTIEEMNHWIDEWFGDIARSGRDPCG